MVSLSNLAATDYPKENSEVSKPSGHWFHVSAKQGADWPHFWFGGELLTLMGTEGVCQPQCEKPMYLEVPPHKGARSTYSWTLSYGIWWLLSPFNSPGKGESLPKLTAGSSGVEISSRDLRAGLKPSTHPTLPYSLLVPATYQELVEILEYGCKRVRPVHQGIHFESWGKNTQVSTRQRRWKHGVTVMGVGWGGLLWGDDITWKRCDK